eukprot:CAMPEP_0119486322 /NCGR_PEP_ID=MMETSP1344-20130328/12753_1 /TAXON_ID=236787 /ORGANISM="Florenciella parvula, Strain CCMP2471" /LENGTH=36 /DNA_ID= /DNA_START= /DNA_END= /DNA_ORIENTATION=
MSDDDAVASKPATALGGPPALELALDAGAGPPRAPP